MTISLTLKSPAKINLFFRVLKKRPDKFHNIASLYQAIDLADTLLFEPSESTQLFCNTPSLTTGNDNLILKAHDAFERAIGKKIPVRIQLIKRIPIGAGLGGGSSNAATTLWALHQLSGQILPFHELIALAQRIGSDVPFFFSKGCSYCEGKGDQITDYPYPFAFDRIWLKTSNTFCSTPHVYKECLTNEMSVMDPKQIYNAFLNHEYIFINDLEPSALRLYPELKLSQLDLIHRGFEHVFMTGSGSCFVGVDMRNQSEVEKMGLIEARLITRKEDTWW
ncbi:MAG: 4-(cytidine 5'-diphospho)-2-C-methyl-D-erythritol kinase [Simkaniaceae bacterium]|nr:4-(cytidine 5'-diphospho)-2-C-methyl-D-erythritol kinase [Simkaniaceae bacterium]